MVLPLLAAGALALGLWTAASIAAAPVAKAVTTALTKPSTVSAASQPTAQQIISNNLQTSESKSFKLFPDNVPIIGGTTVFNLPGGQILSAENRRVQNYNDLLKAGYNTTTAKQISDYQKRLELAGAGGEVVGTVIPSTISNQVGGAVTRTLLNRVSSTTAAKAGTRLTTSIAGSIVGGAYEAPVTSTVQSITRNRPITAQDLGTNALLGAASAGVGGAVVSGAYIKAPKSTVTKAIDWVGQTMFDPYEKVGDVLSNKIPTPISRLGTTTAITPTGAASITPVDSSKNPFGVKTINPFTVTPTQTMSPAMSIVPTNVPTTSQSGKSSTGTAPVPIPGSITPVPVPGSVPIVTPVDTPADTSTDTPTETPTTVPSVSSVPTPIIRSAFIPMPPMSGNTGDDLSTTTKGGLIYYNDLAKGRRILRRMLTI